MAVAIRFNDAVEALKPSYQSIDFRIVMRRRRVEVVKVKDGSNVTAAEEKWIVDLMTVRFSNDLLESVTQRLNILASKYPIRAENLEVILAAKPISEWESMREAFERGTIHIGNDEITLPQDVGAREPSTPIPLQQIANPYCSEWSNPNANAWPILSLISGKFSDNEFESADIQRAAAKIGFARARSVVQGIMELEQSSSSQSAVFIGAPLYAKIEEVEIAGGQLRVLLRRHATIQITLSVFWGPQGSDSFPVPRNRVELIHTRANDGEFCLETYTGPITFEETDWLQVHLFNDALGEIPLMKIPNRPFLPTHVSQFVRREERHQLLAVFERFCKYDQFQSMLLKPAEHKNRKMNEAVAFELHVGWLFSLMNFSVIPLADNETLRATNTMIEQGSIDILAGHPSSEVLFFVACTMTRPNDKDYNNVRNAKGVIEREIVPKALVQPIIVTAASNCTPDRTPRPLSDMGQLPDVTVIDREGLERILTALHSGDVKSALRLVDRSFWP